MVMGKPASVTSKLKTASALIFLMAFVPGLSAQPDFSGVWSGAMTTQDHLYWGPEDYLCFPGCPKLLHDTLGGLLDDPANDDRPTDELVGQTFGVVIADRMGRSTPQGVRRIEESSDTEDVDMAKFCAPYGFVRESLNALPMQISREGQHLKINYEEFNLSRNIYMDGRAHPAGGELTPLGYSTGHMEDDVLVVETTGISGDYFIGLNSPTVHYGSYADGATVVERYQVLQDPRRLVVELTITEPSTLTEPYTWTKTWLSTPDVTLLVDSCEDVPGEIE